MLSWPHFYAIENLDRICAPSALNQVLHATPCTLHAGTTEHAIHCPQLQRAECPEESLLFAVMGCGSSSAAVMSPESRNSTMRLTLGKKFGVRFASDVAGDMLGSSKALHLRGIDSRDSSMSTGSTQPWELQHSQPSAAIRSTDHVSQVMAMRVG